MKKIIILILMMFNTLLIAQPIKPLEDIVIIYNDIENNLKPTKSEFETKSDYQKRISEFKNDSLYTTTLDMSKIKLNYNAEKECFMVDIKTIFFAIYIMNGESIIKDKQGLEVYRISKFSDDYQATNYYGNKVSVHKKSDEIYYLVGSDLPNIFDNISINIKKDIAINLKDNLGIMVLYKLNKPFITDFNTHIAPTINNHYDVYVYIHYIWVDLKEVLIYDKRTGDVLQRSLIKK